MSKRKKKFKQKASPFGDHHHITESDVIKDIEKVGKDWSRRTYGVIFCMIGLLLILLIHIGVYQWAVALPYGIGSIPDDGRQIPEGYRREAVRVYEKLHLEFANYEDSHLEYRLVKIYYPEKLMYIPSGIFIIIGIAHFLPERRKKNEAA